MTKSTILSAAAALFAFAALAVADDEVIEKVMKDGMKGDTSPINQVIKGSASGEQAKELAALIKTLHGTKAPKGEQADYEKKVGDLIAAIDAVAGGDTGDTAIGRLKTASNCKACHSEHRP